MKCPSCKEGNLYLYKLTEHEYRIPLTKNNTFSKRKIHNAGVEYDTTMDYLECDGKYCCSSFDYDLDEKGRVIKDSLIERN